MSTNSNWRLSAISKAALARNKCRSFPLKYGTNYVGKSTKFEVFCPSVLCSREHCRIIVDNDEVILNDSSSNGTYVNDQRIHNSITELKHNDIVSFGFNLSSVYNIKDKNAFVYRVIRDNFETINLDDSDEDENIVDNDVVVVLDSDSDVAEQDAVSEFSSELGTDDDEDELQNIDDDIVISSDEYSDGDIEEDDSLSAESDEFVVTERILNNKNEAVETIDLDEDETDEAQAKTKSVDTEKTKEQADETLASATEKKPENVESMNGTKEPATSTTTIIDAGTSEETEKIETSDDVESDGKVESTVTKADSKEPEAKLVETTASNVSNESAEAIAMPVPSIAATSSFMSRLERVRKSVLSKVTKTASLIAPQPLKKRRRTVSEREYEELKTKRKEEKRNTIAAGRDLAEEKRIRAERLAQLAADQKAAKEAENGANDENIRAPAVLKVKNTPISRAEKLANDMLAAEHTAESTN